MLTAMGTMGQAIPVTRRQTIGSDAKPRELRKA